MTSDSDGSMRVSDSFAMDALITVTAPIRQAQWVWSLKPLCERLDWKQNKGSLHCTGSFGRSVAYKKTAYFYPTDGSPERCRVFRSHLHAATYAAGIAALGPDEIPDWL